MIANQVRLDVVVVSNGADFATVMIQAHILTAMLTAFLVKVM